MDVGPLLRPADAILKEAQMSWRSLLMAHAVVLLATAGTSAKLVGSFRLLETDKRYPLVMLLPWDTWAFDVENVGLSDVEAFDLDFHGEWFYQTTGNTSFQQTAVGPIVFGFDAPETFFVTRPTIPLADVLVAPGTLVDTQTDLKASFTVAGAPSLLSTGEKRAVAFFSVNSGVPLGPANFVSGRATIDGELVEIRYVPEPTSVVLAGFALLIAASCRRGPRNLKALGR